jgi:hypothetical protein
MRDALENALRTGTVIHLVGGTDAKADAIVEEVQDVTDTDLLRIECDADTTDEALPSARLPEGTLVYYRDFGDLPSDVQVSAAQLIKAHFEYGTPVVVRSSEDARGDLTLRNGDLRGRVRPVELNDSAEGENRESEQ